MHTIRHYLLVEMVPFFCIGISKQKTIGERALRLRLFRLGGNCYFLGFLAFVMLGHLVSFWLPRRNAIKEAKGCI